jgi:hypothetical protein
MKTREVISVMGDKLDHENILQPGQSHLRASSSKTISLTCSRFCFRFADHTLFWWVSIAVFEGPGIDIVFLAYVVQVKVARNVIRPVDGGSANATKAITTWFTYR